MGIKEATCDEHWELYIINEPLHSIPEINIKIHVKKFEIKIWKRYIKVQRIDKILTYKTGITTR